MKVWPFVCYYVEKKREDLLSLQLDDHGSMAVAKIWTNKTLV